MVGAFPSMAPDVTAEAGLYSGAGDPLNGAQVRSVGMGESDCSPRRSGGFRSGNRLGERPGHFSGLARRFLSSIVKFIAIYNKERPTRNLFRSRVHHPQPELAG
jgi:hypothetical protein